MGQGKLHGIQGRQIVIKLRTVDSPLNVRRAGGVMGKYPDGAAKVGAITNEAEYPATGGQVESGSGGDTDPNRP